MRKSKIKQTVKKTFDSGKSAGARKIRFCAADSYAGMSERTILKITDTNLNIATLTQILQTKVSCVLSG